jgi:hypothetical protein
LKCTDTTTRAASYGWILTFGPTAKELAELLAAYNSFVLDYCLRNALSQPSIPIGTFEQLIVPSRAAVSAQRGLILPRVLELAYTAWDLQAFALDCGYSGPPFRWNEERRFLLRCELEAAYFHLYLGTPAEWDTNSPQLRKIFPSPRDAVDYIMESFPIVKRRDIKRTEVLDDAGEVVQEGTYITKDTILSIYDEMQHAIDAGHPYQTRLEPTPGPPTDADGNFIPMAQWDESNWPSHIHPPRTEGEVVS